MIVKQDLVRKIKEYFDLNIYETKVWLALLSKGIVSAGETAELSGVPRSRTYDVLESLEKKGFAIVKIGKPVKYIAVGPSTILEKMKTQVMIDAQDKVKTLSNLSALGEYAELEQLYKTGVSPVKSEDISGFMKGRSNVMSKIREVISNAEKEITVYTSASDFEKRARIVVPLLQEAQKRDVKVKLAFSGESEDLKRLSAKHGIKARQGEHKGRYFMADKKEVLFMINAENSEEELAIWLKAPFFTESLDTLVDYHLKK